MFALVLLLEFSSLRYIFGERAIDLVRVDGEYCSVVVLDHVVVVEKEFCVIGGRGKLLPMVNLKLLQLIIVQW